MARPTKLTKDIVRKLDEAFSIDASVSEACYYAGIADSTYYDWMKRFPMLLERFDRLRQRLPLKSRQIIAAQLESNNLSVAQWLLERKRPSEFGQKTEVKHSGSIATSKDDNPEEEAILNEAEEKLRQTMVARIKTDKESEQKPSEPTPEK